MTSGGAFNGSVVVVRVVALLASSLMLVVAIAFVAALWAHINHTRTFEGRLWFAIWGSHGVHTFDLLALGTELTLFAVRAVTLFAGFSRAR